MRGKPSIFRIIKNTTLYGVVLLHMLSFSSQAFATQALSFYYKPTFFELTLIEKAIADSQVLEDLEFASIDLNEDGLSEIIIKTASCTKNPPCLYDILAITPRGGYVNLGRLEANKIILGRGYTHGIRNLILFANALNDYDYKLYIWNPKQKTYVEKKNASYHESIGGGE